MPSYDVIVLGCGAVGSAAAMHLARRGARVLGIDRFNPPHDRGSSHGQTRMIRQAYFEHPDYVPLVQRAFVLWEELARATGQDLYHETGLVEVGPTDGEVVSGVLAAARHHALPVEELSAADVPRRWPGMQAPAGMRAVFERRAGYLRVEDCVAAQIAAARRAGSEMIVNTPVRSWRAEAGGVRVETAAGAHTAARLIVTCGAWAGQMLADLRIPFVVRRKHQYWFEAVADRYDESRGFPAFYFELDWGHYYGFPRIDGARLKAAEHSGGELVGDPAAVDRSDDPLARQRVEQFVAACLPGVGRHVVQHSVCLYTMSPDGHFVIDVHPEWPQVGLAAGLSGHGFKFAPVLGEALADLTLEGKTALPVGFLNGRRTAIRNGS
jgi:monomeric sarcosine oxidase